ncbi:MAG TPA: hypothetical protein VIY51_15890 [Xanthobacteraceae bacterium]
MRRVALVVGLAVAVGACAGRAPQPVAVVQAQDRYSDCAAISAEIEANNQKVQELASEQGLKVGQNVAAGVAGVFVWPLLFAMDFQDSAGKEVAALQSRQQYLTTLAQQRCAPPAPAQPPAVRKRADAAGAYEGRACLETGESRSASGGKVLLWRCVPSNQAHSTTSLPSAVMPTTITVIRGLPDFNWTVSPILKTMIAPVNSRLLIKLAACSIINRYDIHPHGQFATWMDHKLSL